MGSTEVTAADALLELVTAALAAPAKRKRAKKAAKKVAAVTETQVAA